MDLAAAATTFALVFVAELPDKTALTSLVLATRYRARHVWYGVALALGVQAALAVAAGGLFSLLPARVVRAGAAVLFAVGAVLAWRGAGEESERPDDVPVVRGAWHVVATSFSLVFLAEWGDFTQVATATLAARFADPLAVFVGAWLGLVAVATLAITLGRTLLRVVPMVAVRRAAAVLFAVVAVVTAFEALRG